MASNLHLILLIIWPILASIISIVIKANFFVGMLIFLAIPSLFLSILYPKYIKKLLVAAILSLPLGAFSEYIMEMTGGWFAPYSVFGNFRVLHYIIPDVVIWFSLYVYYVLLFYEVFIKKEKKPRLYHPNLNIFLLISCVLILLLVLSYFINPLFLHINYFYFKFGIICCVIPITITLLKYPQLWANIFKTGTYFFLFSLLYELVGLSLNQWTFPGENQYIGHVEIIGLRFPFEEFFVWILLGSMAVISFYELFYSDHNRNK